MRSHYKQTIVIAFLLTLECGDRIFMGRHRECNHFCGDCLLFPWVTQQKWPVAAALNELWCIDAHYVDVLALGFPFVRKEMITTHGLIFLHYIFNYSSSFRSYFTRHAHDHVVFFSIFNINYGEQRFFWATIFSKRVMNLSKTKKSKQRKTDANM